MGIKERKEREKQEKKEIILKAAKEIIKREGIEKLSIRKIAKEIEYSPPMVYHYFKSKEDIVNQLMIEGYKEIISTVSKFDNIDLKPEEKLTKTLKEYIYKALENSVEYKTMMLSESPNILKHTSILHKGASIDRQGIKMLCNTLEAYYTEESIEVYDLELMAQTIWSSVFGLIIRMIIEGIIDDAQRDKLINNHISVIVKSFKI